MEKEPTSLSTLGDFEDLTPQVIFEAVEAVIQCDLESLLIPLPSYINRVYELRTVEGESLIAKFYRPGRWGIKAIQEEHRFINQCAKAEISVIPPLRLSNDSTLARTGSFIFTLYPKKKGRDVNLENPEIWFRLGSLIGRLHAIGSQEKAGNRIILTPELSFQKDIDFLLASNFLEPPWRERFKMITTAIYQLIKGLFKNNNLIRLHGDCHSGNILYRDDEGLLLIDFDDMSMGPAVQDLWLLLPGPVDECQRYLEEFLSGYENFQHFNREELILIEPLRAMRMVYFLSWCAKQSKDPGFYTRFPQYQNKSFWAGEIEDLYEQKEAIEKSFNYY